jgi:hypothetical protein
MASKIQIISGTRGSFSKNVATIIRNLADRHLSTIATESARTMREKVSEGVTRAESTGNLANSIQAERISEGVYGVGNIGILNQNAPYWGAINYGSSHLLGVRVPTGFFQPGNSAPVTGGSGQRWQPAQGGFSFIVGKPINPMSYIEKTIAEQNRIISGVLRTVR